MKFDKSLLTIGFLASFALNAAQLPSPIENVDVYETHSKYLSIHNLSQTTAKIDIYGTIFEIKPASGVSYECESYEKLELSFKYNNHGYFEVPCQSRILINENFKNQY